MRRLTCPTLLCAVGALVMALDGPASAQAGKAEATFRRGVASLHLFEYEDANEAFRQASQIDAGFAMAYWGEAMTYDQTLWRNENVQAARQALARLGSTPAARAARAGSATERAWLAAADTLFGEGDSPTRHRNYADAMGRLYARLPDDPEVASFYALALLGTMSRSLIGYVDTHEGHSQALAGSATQAQVATILNRVLRSHPEHPGALHYLLHDLDDPEHAHLALDAARTLARLAPNSSHALHMPSHIFLQLGMWEDAARSDRAAFAASEAWVRRRHLDPALRSYHALAWLQYELLQLGRYDEAWNTLDEIAPVVKTSGQLTLLSDLSTMRARFVVETERWDLLAQETNFGNANELFAIGMSAARRGNASLAERARQGLAERARDPREGDLRPAIAIMEREVAAVAALTAARADEAIAILRDAARAEADLPPPLGLPEPLKPAPELLGEVLVELGRGAEAVAPFELALRRNPNRSRSVQGLARAAAAARDADAARRHDSRTLLWSRVAVSAICAGLIAAVVVLRRKKRGPVARTPQTKHAKRRN